MRHVPLFPLRSQPLGAPFAWGRCLAATRHSLGSHLTAAQPKLLSGGSAGAHAGTPPPPSQLPRRHFKACEESRGSRCRPRPVLTGGADASPAWRLRWPAFCFRVLSWLLKLNSVISCSGARPALVSGLKVAVSASRQVARGGQHVLHVLMSSLAFSPGFAVS